MPPQPRDAAHAGRDDAMIEIGQRQAEQLIRRFLLFKRKAGMRAGSWAAVQHLQLLHQLPLNHQIHRLVQGGLPLRRTGQAQQHKQAHYEDMTATYVIDENQILRSIEYQITLIMPEITQDLSGNKMLGKDRKMQITVTAEVDRYNQGGIANKVQQYKTLVQEYME